MEHIDQILEKYWGYKAFRPLQREIIQHVLQKRDTLALLPTGGGKSICYQVPALAMEGLCIVITPLIALMKDQVSNLKQRGIKAVAIYSGMSRSEIDIAIDNCIYGDTRFLYLSPERLTTEMIRSRLPKMKVSLVAVDEAHCIAQWGYDFRPPYLEIAAIREFIPDTPFLALTATATSDVIDDICQRLQFKHHQIFRKSFARPNLTYAVIREEDKWSRLLRICNKVAGTGIIYVRNRKKTREIAEYLRQNRISADYYHAGLDAALRDGKQQTWMQEKIRVIVSTNAFGMGIDKPNVRFVVHWDLPDSPEAYFQEAGRGGRDEKKAYAVLLYNQSDILDLEKNLELSFPPLDFIKNLYNTLGNYHQLAIGSGREKSFDFVLSHFCQQYQLDTMLSFNALRFLEKEGYIALSEALANPSRLHILLDKEELYRFQVANPSYDSFLKIILRSYSGLFSDFVKIQEHEIAKRSQLSIDQTSRFLEKLHQMRVAHYIPQSKSPQLTWLHARLDIRDLDISPETYRQRLAYAQMRVRAMTDYVESSQRCRSSILLDYFGEQNATACGVCDVCLDKKKRGLSNTEFQQLIQQIEPLAREKNYTLKQLIAQLDTSLAENTILEAVQWMLDNGLLRIRESDQVLIWVNHGAE